MPAFLLVIAGLAFVLLTFAFRTTLVPVKSILGFLLSVAAALGAEVFVVCLPQAGVGDRDGTDILMAIGEASANAFEHATADRGDGIPFVHALMDSADISTSERGTTVTMTKEL